jgi:sugar/nucleoside kinase (ribokinase family)
VVKRPWDLAAVGEVLVDVLAPGLEPGRVVHGPVTLQPGGTPINAAFAAAALGASCVVIGRVGADPAGTMVRAALITAGIDAALVGDSRAPTGVFLQTGEGDGRGAVADRGASARFAPSDVPDPLVAGVVLVSGYALVHDDSGPAASAALRQAEARYTAVTLGAPGRLRELGAAAFRERAEGAGVVLGNAEEARALTDLEPEDAVRALAEEYGLAAVTAGPAESLVATRRGELLRATPARMLPGEQTGAGDVFAAAFLLALLRGDSPERALRSAV